MDVEKTESGSDNCGRTLQLRGISPIVLLGLAITIIFVLTTTAVIWLNVSSRRALQTQTQDRATRTLAVALARSVEVALAADDVAGLRRIVAEVGAEANLSICRVALADGRVVADLEGSAVTPGDLPRTWPGVAPAADAASETGRTVRESIIVPERGAAVLEVASGGVVGPVPAMNAQTTEIVIGVAGLLVVLVAYRFVLRHLHPVRAVYQALTDMSRGQMSPAALTVCSDFGPQAQAWNALLQEWGDLKQQAALASAREALGSANGDASDLTHACDSLPQGLILVDAQLKIRYANGAANVLLGVQRDPPRMAKLSDLVSDERIISGAKTAAGGPTHKRTIVELQRGETPGAGVLRVIVRPVRRGDRGAAMVIIEDITQQRVAEDSRKAFLAQAAHELRTPLTNIRLCTQEALDATEGTGSPADRQFSVIDDESRRLEKVVGDILSISEIDAGAFQVVREEVHLGELFDRLKNEYISRAREANLVVAFDLPPKLPALRGDQEKILLTLHNLIGNAIKYTPPGGRVTIGVTATERFVTVDVSDTGIGIGTEDRPRIFERFYRSADQRLESITGSGLGLSLARDVAQLHGGDITVQSEIDKGSTFTLTLPLLEEAA